MSTERYYLLNRAAQIAPDGWIHIVPKGELENTAAGIVQVLDDVSLDSILNNIESKKAELGNRWPGLYAGREHFIYDSDQDSAALAWFKDFEKREDGIWANAAGLTPTGKEAIANAEYKFTSFVALREDVRQLGANKARIMRIDTIGFTNQANGKDLLTPMTNRSAQAASSKADGEDVSSMSPERAAAKFAVLVNRTQTAQGWDFTRAWNHCRTTHGILFNRMSGQTGAKPKISNRDDSMARFNALVQETENSLGCTYQKAWALCGAIFPALYQPETPLKNRSKSEKELIAAHQAAALTEAYALANRTTYARASFMTSANHIAFLNRSDCPAGTPTNQWSDANRKAPAVAVEIADVLSRETDRGRSQLFRGPWNQCIVNLFVETVKEYVNQGMTVESAMETIRETEPILWGGGVLNYPLE